MGFNPDLVQSSDDDLLKTPDVGADGELVIGQADNRIGDELAGAVVGDVAAAVGLDDFDAETRKLGIRGDQVSRNAGAAAKGNDLLMLEQKKSLSSAGQDLGMDRFLDGPGVAIGNQAEILDEH